MKNLFLFYNIMLFFVSLSYAQPFNTLPPVEVPQMDSAILVAQVPVRYDRVGVPIYAYRSLPSEVFTQYLTQQLGFLRDTTYGYSGYQLPIWLQPNGTQPTVNSVVKQHGVTLYPDSTVVNNDFNVYMADTSSFILNSSRMTLGDNSTLSDKTAIFLLHQNANITNRMSSATPNNSTGNASYNMQSYSARSNGQYLGRITAKGSIAQVDACITFAIADSVKKETAIKFFTNSAWTNTTKGRVEFYQDSTVINNNLKVRNNFKVTEDSTIIRNYARVGKGTLKNGWSAAPVTANSQLDVLGGASFYDAQTNQNQGIEWDKANGGVSITNRPKRLNNGRSWGGSTQWVQVHNKWLDTLQYSPDGFSRSVHKIVVTVHDTTSTGDMVWPPKTPAYMQSNYPNLRLFSIISSFETANTHLFDVTPTETRVSNGLSVNNATNSVTYFEVTKDSTVIKTDLEVDGIIKSTKGSTISILTTTALNTIKTSLGGTIPAGFTFWHDTNSDGVGDILVSTTNGGATPVWKAVTTTAYGGL